MCPKPKLNIWLYDVDTDVKSHDSVIQCKNHEILNTYDTSFFEFQWLDTFEDVYIHWKVDGEVRTTSLKECLDNKCPYVDKEIRREHNIGRIFWGSMYKKGEGANRC